MNTLKDVVVDEKRLITKGYNAADLVDKTFDVLSVKQMTSEQGDFIICEIVGDGLDGDKDFVTGSKNIKERLVAAAMQNKLPVRVTVIKLGGRAFDIV